MCEEEIATDDVRKMGRVGDFDVQPNDDEPNTFEGFTNDFSSWGTAFLAPGDAVEDQ